jgi:hypothetical protein
MAAEPCGGPLCPMAVGADPGPECRLYPLRMRNCVLRAPLVVGKPVGAKLSTPNGYNLRCSSQGWRMARALWEGGKVRTESSNCGVDDTGVASVAATYSQ